MEPMAIRHSAVLILTATIACAQSQESPVYLEQFRNLSVSVERITNDVFQGNIRRDNQDSSASRVFALQKLVHRLQEEAGGADIEARKRGARPDKRLLLVQQGCMAVDYLLQALASFIDTDYRVFLSLAADGKQAIAAIAKVL